MGLYSDWDYFCCKSWHCLCYKLAQFWRAWFVQRCHFQHDPTAIGTPLDRFLRNSSVVHLTMSLLTMNGFVLVFLNLTVRNSTVTYLFNLWLKIKIRKSFISEILSKISKVSKYKKIERIARSDTCRETLWDNNIAGHYNCNCWSSIGAFNRIFFL